ncbi:aldose 1-epimerase family protein [Aquisphaera insulae]|uniref:aldose 1-epimerase family protein n=1 Tax=Aquisphaera insulae TaxID=2712864 RepID=UPI0013EDFA7A|nr:aldose 1-epimerase family protein [Aquisphaera insulae]
MATFVLTDLSRDIWVESFSIDGRSLGFPGDRRISIRKRRLRGGRREGVDLIEVDNGRLSFAVIPTRGMGIWKGSCDGDRLGWDSPVTDGPVNPAFVNLAAAGGLGWLDGFDELLVRCGLAWNGAPFEVKDRKPDGSESNTIHNLHGKVANIPASYVAVHVAEEPPYEIVVEGHVTEAHLFGPQVRMVARTSTPPGSNRLTVRDEFVNLKDQPVDLQVLYHWNFGFPFLQEDSRFAAPIRTMTPRDPRAVEGLEGYEVYGPPRPGYAEQVYFHELMTHPSGPEAGRTMAMLRNRGGDKAVVLRYRTDELPCFTLWKNTAGARDGYVTGLEPATNYPNPLPFEKARGRVVALPVGGRHVAETTLEVLTNAPAVADAQAEIDRIQSQARPVVQSSPREPFAAES